MGKETSHHGFSFEERVWGALSYFWIVSVIALIARKNNSYIRFHANQGVLLFAFSLFIWLPFLGWLLWLFVVILCIVGAFRAFFGVKWKLPFFDKAAVNFGSWVVKILKV